MTAPPFELPANAPSACPACGGPWTYGYEMRKPIPCSAYQKKVPTWVLVCENAGCGKGRFIGSELRPEQTKGLRRFDYETRKREVLSMAEEKEDNGAGKGWGGTYECCQNCGTTERRRKARGLCTACYSRLHYQREKQRRGEKDIKPRKARVARAASAPATKARAKDDGDLVDVTLTLRLSDLSPKLQAEIKTKVAEKLTDRVLTRLGGR